MLEIHWNHTHNNEILIVFKLNENRRWILSNERTLTKHWQHTDNTLWQHTDNTLVQNALAIHWQKVPFDVFQCIASVKPMYYQTWHHTDNRLTITIEALNKNDVSMLSMWIQCIVSVSPVYCQSESSVMSVWIQCDVSVNPVLCQCEFMRIQCDVSVCHMNEFGYENLEHVIQDHLYPSW